MLGTVVVVKVNRETKPIQQTQSWTAAIHKSGDKSQV